MEFSDSWKIHNLLILYRRLLSRLVWKIMPNQNFTHRHSSWCCTSILGKCRLCYISNMSKHIHKSTLAMRNSGSHILIWSSSYCSCCCCRGIHNKWSDGSWLVYSCTDVFWTNYGKLQSSKLVCRSNPSRCTRETTIWKLADRLIKMVRFHYGC